MFSLIVLSVTPFVDHLFIRGCQAEHTVSLHTQVSEYMDITLRLRSQWLVSGINIVVFDYVFTDTGGISLCIQMNFALQFEKFLCKINK